MAQVIIWLVCVQYAWLCRAACVLSCADCLAVLVRSGLRSWTIVRRGIFLFLVRQQKVWWPVEARLSVAPCFTGQPGVLNSVRVSWCVLAMHYVQKRGVPQEPLAALCAIVPCTRVSMHACVCVSVGCVLIAYAGCILA